VWYIICPRRKVCMSVGVWFVFMCVFVLCVVSGLGVLDTFNVKIQVK
jgi:hypothetical protein